MSLLPWESLVAIGLLVACGCTVQAETPAVPTLAPAASDDVQSHPPATIGEQFAFQVKTPNANINVGAKLAVEALWRSAAEKAGVVVPTVNEPTGSYPRWVHPYDNFWMNFVTPYFFSRESVELPIRLFAAYQPPTGEIGGGVYHIPTNDWRKEWAEAGGERGWQGAVATPLALTLAGRAREPDRIEYGIYVRDHLFVRQVYEQWRSSGYLPFLIEMYPHCRQALKYLETRRDTNHNGLIETTTVLSDIVVNGDSDVFSTERSEDQVMLYGALRGFEAMANQLGGEDAQWASKWAERIKELTNKTFWRPEGRYIFGVERESRKPRLEYVTTTYTNGYAILYGIADDSQTGAILDFMAAQKFVVPGPYHIPPIRAADKPGHPPGVYCNGGCGWGRGIMPSVTLACFEKGRIAQGVDYLDRQAAAARKAGSFREYWNWEEFTGNSDPGGATWYSETSAGFLDALLHGLFGISSPKPGFHSLSLAPKFPADWNDASIELRVPSGSRVHADFHQDKICWKVKLTANPALPIELTLKCPPSGAPEFSGTGFEDSKVTNKDSERLVSVSFATGTGELVVSQKKR